MMTDSNSLLGKTLGTCTLEYLLSQGGMGTVYVARQLRPHRMVAVKVLLSGSALKKQAQADFLARFRREADAIAALDHVHVMPLYEYGELGHLAYLVMPYVTGGTLRECLLARGALPLHEALPILEQAAGALDYAHERGILHRDIKPSNMLFHADGRLLLADFGLAKMVDNTRQEFSLAGWGPADLEAMQAWSSCHDEQATRAISLLYMSEDAEATRRVNWSRRWPSSEAVIGTPEYLAPERALGQPVDRRADVYSLGVVFFQMLTGRVPFAGSSAISTALMHTEEEPPLPSALLPDLTPEMEMVILRSLAKDPAQRYATAGDFARALRQAAKCTTTMRKIHILTHVPPLFPDQSCRAGYPQAALPVVKRNIVERKPYQSQRQYPAGFRNVLFFALCSLFILSGLFASLAQDAVSPPAVSARTHHTPKVQPTTHPIVSPAVQPTGRSTMSPMTQPTTRPTMSPTARPTNQPTTSPTAQPTSQPTTSPTAQPTSQPTTSPTAQPTSQPTVSPTAQPTGHVPPSGSVPFVSVGAQLYASTLLRSACSGEQGAWSQVSGLPTPHYYSSETVGVVVSTNTTTCFRNLAVYVLP